MPGPEKPELTAEQSEALKRLADTQLAFERQQAEQLARIEAMTQEERDRHNIGTPNPDHQEP